jgi:3',5'-cyclic AMP phosphodiesterase CpdA
MINMKKYIAFLVIILVFILVGCTSASINLKEDYKLKSGKDITFYTATDLHYLSNRLNDNGEAFRKYLSSGDGKQLKYIDEILDAFTYNIQKTNPNILIISGDLTNNGEKESHLDLSKKLKDIEKSGTSVYVIPGNHDISNPWARGFKGDKQYVTESIKQKDFSKIYSDFGYDEAISKDKDTLSYLAAPSPDVWLLMIDTNKYKNNYKIGSPQRDGEITNDTLNWIKKCSDLAKEKGADIITVTHHNIIDHSDVIQTGYTLNNNDEIINVFKNNKLNLVLSGHIHIQDISSHNNQLYDIVTGSLAVYPHQYGTLKYSAKDISFDYTTSMVDVEKWSKDKKIVDKNLNDFKSYSEDYFGKFAYDMAYKHLIDNKSYSEDEVNSMSETMKILNLRYFAGNENLNSDDVINSEGFKLWSGLPESFLKSYIWSIASDKDTDDNNLRIKIQSKKLETN